MKPFKNILFERLFGSNDMHLLRKCPCPVWIMKPPEKSKYSSILAAVDFDPVTPAVADQVLNREILDLSSSLALTDSASLHIVHAWEAFAESTMLSRGDISLESIYAYAGKQQSLHQKGLDKLGEKMRDWIGTDVCGRLSPRFHLSKDQQK
jgi:universal stress protein E